MSILRPSRRDILKLTAAAPALALTPAMANTAAPAARQNAGFFRFSLGAAQLTVISDGYFTTSTNGLGVNADESDVITFLESYYQDVTQRYAHTNHIVVELGAAKILVDVGSGSRFQPTTGQMLENLEAAGIDASSITHVALTHAHPDHIWGIRDDFDEAIFPDAQYLIGNAEHQWWTKDNRVNEVPEAMQQIVLGAVNSLAAVNDRLALVENNHQIAPGIRMIDTPGHTLGHMSLIVESDGQSLLIIGDAITHPYVSFQHPEWYSENDMDGDLTINTRRRLLDMSATDRMTVLGYHFPFPGVGYVKSQGDTYQFIPALWQWDAG